MLAIGAKGQLFPFSSLAEHAKGLVDPPRVEQVAIETNERPSRHVDPEARTVLVTPRPRYTPHSFAQEPAVGPDNASVPSMLGEPKRQTLVESVPSLSVALPSDHGPKRLPLPDYLLPPRFPSVYDSSRATLAEFDTSPLTESRPRKDKPYSGTHKDWHRKPDKKHPKRKLLPKGYKPTRSAEQHFPQQEQITSETGFSSGTSLEDSPSERVEFQMHGQAGPASYKFGYDTGTGKNRQFRFEEKDHIGNVKGQYGYYDKEGNLKIFNYQADENGFRSHPL